MTTPNQLREEFQAWVEKGMWQGEDEFTKNFAVGNVSDWWLVKLEEAKKEAVEGKNGAYRERDMLVCALSKLFPSYLARHSEEDKAWEDDWRWIVYINIPTRVKVVSGDQHNHVPESKWFETKVEQISWHIHDSEREMFNHLEVKENNWDGHNTERKYQRLQALHALHPHSKDEK